MSLEEFKNYGYRALETKKYPAQYRASKHIKMSVSDILHLLSQKDTNNYEVVYWSGFHNIDDDYMLRLHNMSANEIAVVFKDKNKPVYGIIHEEWDGWEESMHGHYISAMVKDNKPTLVKRIYPEKNKEGWQEIQDYLAKKEVV